MKRRALRCLLPLLAVNLSGCQTMSYYTQAVEGQLSLLAARKPITELLQDQKTPARLRERLEQVQSIRAFAGSELKLPAAKQYDSYVELGRPYPVWSVTAAPALSLTPQHWCYWFVGCLTYRGFFSEAAAKDYATSLRHEGLDADIGGVPAYSTLGWFRDPVLSSFVYDPDASLAELLFHELAHQLLFVPGDTVFNESFAVTVADEGLQRYSQVHTLDMARLQLARQRHAQFVTLVQAYRARLQDAFASGTEAEKQAAKQRLYGELQAAYVELRQQWGGYKGYDDWFAHVNNARLNTVATYYDEVPALQALLASKHHDLPAFYEACRQLAKLTPEERRQQLQMNKAS